MGWLWFFIVVVALILIARIRVNVPDRMSDIQANLRGTGGFNLEAVGESHYQPALRAIAGPGEVRYQCRAELVLEDENPYDDKAVRIDVAGRTVAYLKRADARSYRKQMAAFGRVTAQCDALIIGGGKGRSLGIWGLRELVWVVSRDFTAPAACR